MKNKKFNRRNFLHKLVGITALGGIVSLILGQKVDKVSGAISGSIEEYQIAYGTGTDIIGGSNNLRWDNALRNFIGGYSGNSVTSGVVGATISGGGALNYENKVTDIYGTIGGGRNNRAGNDSSPTSDCVCATVGGGVGNTAGNEYASVGGGFSNQASGACSTVGGGFVNNASGNYSTVGGGVSNTANGLDSTVPGGISNVAAGDYSLAAGRRAKIDATHDGAFLFADSTVADFNSARANEFAVRCTNGSRFIADSSNPAVKGNNTSSGDGVHGLAGSGTGVRGEATGTGAAIYAENSGNGYALHADSDHNHAVRGVSQNSIGVSGYSSSGNPGVKGESSSGIGVYGETGSSLSAIEGKNTGSGIGVKAASTSGTALHVEGKNYFKSAQRGTISTGVRYYDVTVSSGITIASDAMIFVTLMNNPSNIGVKYVERLTDTTFRIHLTGKSRGTMNFGYFVVN